MASILSISWRNICCLKSGPVSITICLSLHEIITDDRNLLSLMLADKHTGSLLPIIGMPCDVPVPKNIISKRFLIIYLRLKITAFIAILKTKLEKYIDNYHTYSLSIILHLTNSNIQKIN